MLVPEGTKIVKKYTHLEFLEKIAEGYVIEAYKHEEGAVGQNIAKLVRNLCLLETARSL